MAKLHILSGAQEGKVIELSGERISVGRAPDNMICLVDGLVSTYHAMFVRDGAGYRLRDLNSTNHTRVNGVFTVETKLRDGDQVRFGLVEMRFETDVKPAREPVLAAPSTVPTFSPPRPRTGSMIGIGVSAVALIIVVWLVAVGLTDRRVSPPRGEAGPAAPPLVVEKHDGPATPEAVAPEPPRSVATQPANVTSGHEHNVTERDAPVDLMPFTSNALVLANQPEGGQLDLLKQMESDRVQPEKSGSPPKSPASTPPANEQTNKTTSIKAAPLPPAPPSPRRGPPQAPASSSNMTHKGVSPVARTLPGTQSNPFENPKLLASLTPIDQLVFNRLQRLGIRPAPICSDEVFVRRVSLDVIGTLPTAKETRAFLEDRNPNKRHVLIDRLLERDEFADYWAMKWCDLLRVKSEFPINLWPNAVQAYHQWIRTSLKKNRPYDRFARDLLTSSGSNFREPPVNFYRAVQSKDPQTLAQTVALTFMGTRAEKWPKERLAGMATFFSQVGYKSTAEWKEEIVFFDPSKATNTTAAAVFPDGSPADLPVGMDPRAIFANWLITPGNPWFTRNIANRVWSWLLGRGIINEPDDSRPDNPPANPELLAYLERELIAARYDLKAIYRLILKSKTYQLSCIPTTNSPAAEANFAFYPVRRLEAEVLIDAINQITGTTEKYSSPIPEPFTFIPENERSIALADGSISSPFLELFGRSPRTTGMEVERNNRPTAAQQLHLLNSSHIQRKIEQSAKLRSLLQEGRGSAPGVVDALYLTILSRYPTDEEQRTISAYNRSGDWSQRAGWDLAWALINSAEFQQRH